MQDQFKLFNPDSKSKEFSKTDRFKGKDEPFATPNLEQIKLDNKNCKSPKKIKSNRKRPGLVLKPISEIKQVFILPLPRESIKGAAIKNIKHKPIKSCTTKNIGNLSERSHKNEEAEDCLENIKCNYKEVLEDEEKLDPLIVDQNLKTRQLEANPHSASKSMHDFQFPNTYQSYPKNPQESVDSFDKPISPPNMFFPSKTLAKMPNSSSQPFPKNPFQDLKISPEVPTPNPSLYENPLIFPQKISNQIEMPPPKLGVPQPWSSDWVLSPQSKPQNSPFNPNPILNLNSNPSFEDQNYISISEHPPLVLKSQGIILPNMHTLPPPPLKASLTQHISENNQKLPLPINNPIHSNILTPESKPQKHHVEENKLLAESENHDKNKQDFFIPPPPLFYCPPVNAVPVINWSNMRNIPSPVVEDKDLLVNQDDQAGKGFYRQNSDESADSYMKSELYTLNQHSDDDLRQGSQMLETEKYCLVCNCFKDVKEFTLVECLGSEGKCQVCCFCRRNMIENCIICGEWYSLNEIALLKSLYNDQ